MKRSVEKLYHFQCAHCDKWWSVGDAPEDRAIWYCPWCKWENNYSEEKETGWKCDEEFIKKWIHSCNTACKYQLEMIAKMFDTNK